MLPLPGTWMPGVGIQENDESRVPGPELPIHKREENSRLRTVARRRAFTGRNGPLPGVPSAIAMALIRGATYLTT